MTYIKKDYEGMLADVFFKRDISAQIAKKYGYTPGFISQIKKKIFNLKHPPKTKDGKIVCFICEKEKPLQIHHNHSTGAYIAILCKGCNSKVGFKEIDIMTNEEKVTHKEFVILKRCSKGLVNFLNEIKNTFFNSESKFTHFSEILKRYITMDDLMEIEMITK